MTPTDERGPKTPKDHATRSTRLTTVEAVKCNMMARFTHYFQRTIQHPRTILNDSRLNWKQEGLRLIKSPRAKILLRLFLRQRLTAFPIFFRSEIHFHLRYVYVLGRFY